MRRDLDAGPPRLGIDDGDSGPETGIYDPEAPRPIPFAAMFEQPHSLTLPPLHNVPPEPENPQYIPNIPKRFDNAISGIGAGDDSRHRWVPPPPFGPPLKKYEDDPEKYGLPPATSNVPPPPPVEMLNGSSYPQNPKVPPNTNFAYPSTNFNATFNPKYYRDQSRGMHNPSSGSAGSVSEMKTGSHLLTSPSNAETTSTLPPLHRVLSAHDRDRSDQSPYSATNSISGNSGPTVLTPQISPQTLAYNGLHNNNSDPRSSMYNLAPPSLSPSSTPHVSSSFAPAKPVMGSGYNQTTPSPAPGYAQSPEAGQSSGTSSP